MHFTRSLAASTAITWALLAPAAYADLTAAQVWDDWRGYMQGMGYVVTADEASEGNQLAVSNINVGMAMADQAGAMNLSLGTMTFIEQRDGTVEIVMPAVLPMSMTITPENGGKPTTFEMSVTQSGHKSLVSGTPEEMAYDYSADQMAIKLDQMTVDDESFGNDHAKFDLTLNSITSKTELKVRGTERIYRQQLKSGPMVMDLLMDPPDEPTRISFRGQTESLQFVGDSKVPVGTDSGDMMALLDANFGFDATIVTGPGSTEADIVAPEGPNTLKSTSGGGSFNVKMSDAGVRYGGDQSNVTLEGQLAGLPFPITLSMAETGFLLETPILKSDDPQNFTFGLSLKDFTMSDMIWGLFDPQSQLPRDPATIIVDLSGGMTLLADFLDPKAMEKLATTNAQPAEIERLNVDQFKISAVGAEMNGTGQMTFDNTDTVTIPGIPKPVGQINLALTGGNGLLDKLVAMGFVPQENAMRARMMMGLFTVPGEGEDSLKSKIEFTEEGQILANGQRIK